MPATLEVSLDSGHGLLFTVVDTAEGDTAYRVDPGGKTRRLLSADTITEPVAIAEGTFVVANNAGVRSLWKLGPTAAERLQTFDGLGDITLTTVGRRLVIRDDANQFWTSDGGAATYSGQLPPEYKFINIEDARDGKVLVQADDADDYIDTRYYLLVTPLDEVVIIDRITGGFHASKTISRMAFTRDGIASVGGTNPTNELTFYDETGDELDFLLDNRIEFLAAFDGYMLLERVDYYMESSIWITDGTRAGTRTFDAVPMTARSFKETGYSARYSIGDQQYEVFPDGTTSELSAGATGATVWQTDDRPVRYGTVVTQNHHGGVGTKIDGKETLLHDLGPEDESIGRLGDDLLLLDTRADVPRIMRIPNAATPPIVPVPGTLTGTVFADHNNDGDRDDREEHLVGFRVFVDLDENGRWTSDEPAQRIDNRTGTYYFVLPAGDYTLARTAVGGEYVPNSPLSVGITVPEDGVATHNFAVGKVAPATITARAMQTQNGNTSAMPGVRMYLDTNGDGRWNKHEPTDRTNEFGVVQFMGLQSGTYRLGTVVPLGGNWQLDRDPIAIVDAAAGETQTIEFVNTLQVPDGIVTGTLWLGANGDNKFNPTLGEVPLSGFRVYADLNDNGRFDVGEPSDRTDAAGEYVLSNLTRDRLPIRVVHVEGYTHAIQSIFTADLRSEQVREVFVELLHGTDG